jgi:hypothetical protein
MRDASQMVSTLARSFDPATHVARPPEFNEHP